MDGSQAEGSGFVFPADSTNLLYIGGFWVGLNSSYVANRDYDADPNKEWVVSTNPDGHIWIDGFGSSDQDIHAAFTDAGSSEPRGMTVHQESWAFAEEPDDELVILRYFVENNGGSILNEFYAGVFLDFDIGSATENTGGVDVGRHLVYVSDESGTHAGLSVLMGVRSPDGEPIHDLPVNQTLIHNPTYVWPNEHILDADKFAFLAASDPDHILAEGITPDDYSVLVSVGPITLEPGEMREVAFAILGGESLENLFDNADRVQVRYQFATEVPDRPVDRVLTTRLLPNAPNPFNPSTMIRFELARSEDVTLDLYDAGGRLVRPLVRGRTDPGLISVVWDGRDANGRMAGSGVYFLRLVAGEVRDKRTIVLMK
jgi:hypothetical protein